MPLRLDVTRYIGSQPAGNRLGRIVKSLVDQGYQPFSAGGLQKTDVLIELFIGRCLVREEVMYYARVPHDGAVARLHRAESAVELNRAVAHSTLPLRVPDSVR